jgi:hypothetical protein
MTNREIQRKLDKLEALEAGGIDNWEFYDCALKEWNDANHKDECIDQAIENINDLLIEAEVEEPAGHGAGYSINLDENVLFKILNNLIKNVQNNG